MLSLPHIWTPRKCLWLPGMALNPLGRFGVCANCCGETVPCTPCGGTGPPEYLVTLAGFADNHCDQCENSNGDFVLPFSGESGGQCGWRDSFSPGVCDQDECGGHDITVELFIDASYMRVLVWHFLQLSPCFGAPPYIIYTFRIAFPEAGCFDLSADFPIYNIDVSNWYFGQPNSCGSTPTCHVSVP